jgi:hypothetical protein
MAKYAPAIGVLGALVGGSVDDMGRGLLLVALVPLLGGAWLLVRRRPAAIVAPALPTDREERRAFVRRGLAKMAMGHRAQRADRAFGRAAKAAELLTMPEFLPQPQALRARLDHFDICAGTLTVAVSELGGVEGPLAELEVAATSLGRYLPD